MGGIQSKNYKKKPSEKKKDHVLKGLREKVRLLEKENNEIMLMRENERQTYEQEVMVHAFKEGEWKKERKRLREEVKKLRKTLLEERNIRDEKEIVVVGDHENLSMRSTEKADQCWDWQLLGISTSYLVEQMREEGARRDEAVEKWKRLYLAIKVELDDLLQRTHQGERMYWKAGEEDLMEELQKELKAKEETNEILEARMASMEQEGSKREREIDILRQSLKIMSHKKKPNNKKCCQ